MEDENIRLKRRALREWVKFNLAVKGLSLAELSRLTHCDLPTAFFRPFPRAERIIADALDLEPWELWPDRYGPDNKPNRVNP